jgi:hypothetical protein
MPSIDSRLIAAGFGSVPATVPARIIASTAAQEKTGKTHFGLTYPKPIAVICHDPGTEDVIRLLFKSGELRPQDVILAGRDGGFAIQKGMSQSDAKVVWTKVKQALVAIVDTKSLRTILIDTFTESWQLCRLALLGKLSQVKPHHYDAVNAEFRDVMKLIEQRDDLNALYIHKLRKQYSRNKAGDDSWDGKSWERAGFDDVRYHVDLNLENYWLAEANGTPAKGDDGKPIFGVRCLDVCRLNPEVTGIELEGEMCSFPYLAVSVYPETQLEEWA